MADVETVFFDFSASLRASLIFRFGLGTIYPVTCWRSSAIAVARRWRCAGWLRIMLPAKIAPTTNPSADPKPK
jgi:hypothetical protein